MGEVAGDAVVAGPVVEAGVGVPLEELEGALDAADALDGLPCGVGEVGLLPAFGCGGGAAPVLVAEEEGWAVDAFG